MSIDVNEVSPTTNEDQEGGELRRRRGVAVLAAGGAATLAWVMTVPVAGAQLRVPAQPGAAPAPELGLVPLVVASVVATALGWALLVGLERATSRPRTIWTAVAVAFTAVSLGGPFSGTGIDTPERVLLALFHLVVAAVAIPLLRRTTSDVRRTGATR